ncbi:hypothetical protein KFK09_000838 [Dendrobium nobile]|uniref:Uncharacterized protein n=1 Tax=Dendrobium nobile TaxID=94219 RepID=A0A8T3CCP4_DENNO|nr:hypothetical protein KFK09_000838 [Dendrobium nobile]
MLPFAKSTTLIRDFLLDRPPLSTSLLLLFTGGSLRSSQAKPAEKASASSSFPISFDDIQVALSFSSFGFSLPLLKT